MDAVNRLAIFDIDGTLTDTNGVDDDCYRAAVAGALRIDPGSYDWTKAAHITDAGIFQWVAGALGRPEPSRAERDSTAAPLTAWSAWAMVRGMFARRTSSACHSSASAIE
jgi:hypothetical protein